MLIILAAGCPMANGMEKKSLVPENYFKPRHNKEQSSPRNNSGFSYVTPRSKKREEKRQKAEEAQKKAVEKELSIAHNFSNVTIRRSKKTKGPQEAHNSTPKKIEATPRRRPGTPVIKANTYQFDTFLTEMYEYDEKIAKRKEKAKRSNPALLTIEWVDHINNGNIPQAVRAGKHPLLEHYGPTFIPKYIIANPKHANEILNGVTIPAHIKKPKYLEYVKTLIRLAIAEKKAKQSVKKDQK